MGPEPDASGGGPSGADGSEGNVPESDGGNEPEGSGGNDAEVGADDNGADGGASSPVFRPGPPSGRAIIVLKGSNCPVLSETNSREMALVGASSIVSLSWAESIRMVSPWVPSTTSSKPPS